MLRSLLAASVIACLVAPAYAQQQEPEPQPQQQEESTAEDTPLLGEQTDEDMHWFITRFQYNNAAIRAMVDNPQNRQEAVKKLTANFGGKLIGIFINFSLSDNDGFVLWQFPDEKSMTAAVMLVRASGNFSRLETAKLITADQFMDAMQMAKEVQSEYTPPTETSEK